MFAYNPTVNDRSGEILGAGQMQAAQTNAQMMGQLGSDIGGALASIGNMYGEIEGNKAKGRAFKDVFKVIAPSAGIDLKQLETLTGGSLKNDMDWYNARETMAPLLPALINAQLTQGRMGIQKQAPYVDQMLDNQRDVAGGKKTWNPGGGGGMPAPVEPALPEPPPAVVAPGPAANSVTDADRQRAMGWWQKRSQGGP
jgi:hypothetical protein